MKKLLTFAVLLGLLLSLQVSFVGAQEPDQAETPPPTIYTVVVGDTADSIAAMFGISVSDLLAANGLSSPGEIVVGMTLVIPPAAQPTEEPTEEVTEQPTAEPTEEVTEEPTVEPTQEATEEPTEEATEEPTAEPTEEATEQPTEVATEQPTAEPTAVPTETPTPVVDESDGDVSVQGSFNPGTGVSRIAVMNTDSAGPAAYNILFYGQSAGSDDTTTLASQGPLNYRGVAYYDLATLGLAFGSGWIGSAVIEADKEVFAAVDQTYSGGQYTGGDGLNGEAYESTTPATDIFLPYATQAATGNVSKDRFSRITIQGTQSSGTTNLTISYWDQNGNDVAACNSGNTSRTLEGSRSISFEPVFKCATAGEVFNGSMRIVASDPVNVTFDGSWASGWKTAYNGIDATKASNKLYFPSIFRRLPNGPWEQWSNIFVQNTSGTQVTARVTWYKIGQTTETFHWDITLPPFSAKEINTRVGGTGFTNPTAAEIAALGSNFNGGAVVEKTSGPDNALVGVAHNFWGSSFLGGSTYAALTESEAGATVYAPFAYRQKSGSNWTQWSKITVMNITGSPVSVEVKYYNPDGSLHYDLTAATGAFNVANGSVVAVNTRVGCDLSLCSSTLMNNISTSFTGSVVVSSTTPGAKLAGVMNILYPSRLNTFNAQAK